MASGPEGRTRFSNRQIRHLKSAAVFDFPERRAEFLFVTLVIVFCLTEVFLFSGSQPKIHPLRPE